MGLGSGSGLPAHGRGTRADVRDGGFDEGEQHLVRVTVTVTVRGKP